MDCTGCAVVAGRRRSISVSVGMGARRQAWLFWASTVAVTAIDCVCDLKTNCANIFGSIAKPMYPFFIAGMPFQAFCERIFRS